MAHHINLLFSGTFGSSCDGFKFFSAMIDIEDPRDQELFARRRQLIEIQGQIQTEVANLNKSMKEDKGKQEHDRQSNWFCLLDAANARTSQELETKAATYKLMAKEAKKQEAKDKNQETKDLASRGGGKSGSASSSLAPPQASHSQLLIDPLKAIPITLSGGPTAPNMFESNF